MPRRVFTKRNIGARTGLKLGPYDFSDALRILGRTNDQQRQLYGGELAAICDLHKHVRLEEADETPAAKAEAFKRAHRIHRRRQRALRSIAAAFPLGQLLNEVLDELPVHWRTWPYRGKLEKVLAGLIAARLKKVGLEQEAQQRCSAAAAILQDERWLPASLEQEAARLQSRSGGRSLEEAFIELENWHRQQARAGRQASRALGQTIYNLQRLACGVSPQFAWRGGKVPPKLIDFLTAVLRAAKIRYPDPDNNPSKFRRLDVQARHRFRPSVASIKCRAG